MLLGKVEGACCGSLLPPRSSSEPRMRPQMAVLIAHLTDLHVKTPADPILGRHDLVARAIATEIDALTDAVVIAIGGDSAFSGKPEQFEHARTFFLGVLEKLQQERPHPAYH